MIDITAVLTDQYGKPLTQNKKAITLRDVFVQALNNYNRQIGAYQAFVTLAKADLLERLGDDAREVELSRAETALLLEAVGATVVVPVVLRQAFDVLNNNSVE